MGLLLLAQSTPSPAADITGEEVVGENGLISQMPGSEANFMFFATEEEILTDFTVTPSPGTSPFDNIKFTAQIKTPGESGSLISTGALFTADAGGVYTYDAQNVASFTLSNKNSTFDYSNFDVYVLYSNAPGLSQKQVDEIRLAQGTDATGDGAATVAVIDDNRMGENPDRAKADGQNVVIEGSDFTHGKAVKFHIKGAAAGDTFTIGLFSRNKGLGAAYLGGISFQSKVTPPVPAKK